MRRIDMENWPRRQHFDVFNAFEHPHFNMCANVNLTAFYPAVKERGCSINVAIIYVLARASNDIPEFRQRIRGDQVVEHDVIHPSVTVPTDDDLFAFCSMDYYADFPEFSARAIERIAYYQENPTLDDHGRDDLMFMSAIPWVSFTSVMHPMRDHPGDSVPRYAWGKFFKEGEALKMPLGVQAHHALMDGLHMGRSYQEVQGYFDNPDNVLGSG